jgi:hypothetical protein
MSGRPNRWAWVFLALGVALNMLFVFIVLRSSPRGLTAEEGWEIGRVVTRAVERAVSECCRSQP